MAEPRRHHAADHTTHQQTTIPPARPPGKVPAQAARQPGVVASPSCMLRFDFWGDSDRLRQVSCEEWENRSDGAESNFFRLESPDREDS